MAKTIGAVLALAAAAFCVAYFGGALLTKSEAAEPAGAALRAPRLAVDSQPVAMVTPTASPSPTATPKPKKKKHKKKAQPKAKAKAKVVIAPRPTAVPTAVVTAVPTRAAPVYRPPAQTTKPKRKRTPIIIIED